MLKYSLYIILHLKMSVLLYQAKGWQHLGGEY